MALTARLMHAKMNRNVRLNFKTQTEQLLHCWSASLCTRVAATILFCFLLSAMAFFIATCITSSRITSFSLLFEFLPFFYVKKTRTQSISFTGYFCFWYVYVALYVNRRQKNKKLLVESSKGADEKEIYLKNMVKILILSTLMFYFCFQMWYWMDRRREISHCSKWIISIYLMTSGLFSVYWVVSSLSSSCSSNDRKTSIRSTSNEFSFNSLFDMMNKNFFFYVLIDVIILVVCLLLLVYCLSAAYGKWFYSSFLVIIWIEWTWQ